MSDEMWAKTAVALALLDMSGRFLSRFDDFPIFSWDNLAASLISLFFAISFVPFAMLIALCFRRAHKPQE